MAPSEPISRRDFHAMRDLVSGRSNAIAPSVVERLVRGGWLVDDAGAYLLTDRARRFLARMKPPKVRWFYAGLTAAVAALFGGAS